MIYVVAIVGCMFCFYIGILLGIHDCKKRFHIPKGCETFDDYLDGLFPPLKDDDDDFYLFGDDDGIDGAF